MDFRLLGPFEVWHEGRALELRRLKRRAVLALLLLHANEVVSRDRLIDELWDEDPPANAAAALQNHISRLRKDLGPDLLVTRFRIPPLGRSGGAGCPPLREAGGGGRRAGAPERRAKLDEALGIWRGQALADLLQEHTLAIESGRLEGLRLAALERRIEADLELGHHEQVVPETEALIAAYPLREHLRALLILALYRCGRQADALEAYRETRRTLVDELGIDPGPELRELEQAILRQDPALTAPPAVRAAPAPLDAGPAPKRRYWPLVAVAGVALGAAGLAAAFLVSHQSAFQPAQFVAGSTVPFIPHLGPLTTDTFRPHQHAHKTTTAAATTAATTAHESHASHHGRTGTTTRPRVTVLASTIPQPPLTTSTRPAHAGNPPPPPPPPPKAWAYWLTDDFTDPEVDAMWRTSKSGPGIDMAEQTGELQVWVPSDPIPDPSKGIGEIYSAKCSVAGDFDATVDYQLLNWPAGDGLHLALLAGVSGTVGKTFAIERVSGHADGFGGDAYQSNLGAGARVATADTHGSLRLVRRGGVLRSYYRYRGSWIPVAAQKAKGEATLWLSFNSDNPPWGGQPALAAFDNFQAIAAGVDCPPGTPVPPRKRRT